MSPLRFNPIHIMNPVLKHALLSEVGKYLAKNPMGLDACAFVLRQPVSVSVWSELEELFSSNPNKHRGERGAIERHGFPT